jgi:ABC-type lipoprotein export system ATPase subunit
MAPVESATAARVTRLFVPIGALLADLARSTGTAVVCATHDPAVIEQADVQVPL